MMRTKMLDNFLFTMAYLAIIAFYGKYQRTIGFDAGYLSGINTALLTVQRIAPEAVTLTLNTLQEEQNVKPDTTVI